MNRYWERGGGHRTLSLTNSLEYLKYWAGHVPSGPPAPRSRKPGHHFNNSHTFITFLKRKSFRCKVKLNGDTLS